MFNGVFVVVTVGFGALTLYSLALALDYKGRRAAAVRRFIGATPFSESRGLARGLDLYGRLVAWLCVLGGTFGFVCAAIATISTFQSPLG